MSGEYQTPAASDSQAFTDARAAVDRLIELYDVSTHFLRDAFRRYLENDIDEGAYRAFYPEVQVRSETYARGDSRLAYGHIDRPGIYATTITQPRLFANYLQHQFELLMQNHGRPVEIRQSEVSIPLHFALEVGSPLSVQRPKTLKRALREVFDVPDIAFVNDYIVNGTYEPAPGLPIPLAPFPAQRIDYSVHRLVHYSATAPEHFQNFVLFTNYPFYMDEFCRIAREMMAKGDSGYDSFVEPGNVITKNGESEPSQGQPPRRAPQMPAYHLTAGEARGITLINIGVGPSNAKTITDHVAVLRPHAWLMLGHCAGLRNTQELGDYVLVGIRLMIFLN